MKYTLSSIRGQTGLCLYQPRYLVCRAYVSSRSRTLTVNLDAAIQAENAFLKVAEKNVKVLVQKKVCGIQVAVEKCSL